MRTDDDLYESFIAGDKTCLDELMLRYGDSLICYLYGYLKSMEDAEDLMIDTFARLMVKRPSIKSGCFKAYLYKIARNLAARFYTRQHRAEMFSMDGLETEPEGAELIEDTILGSEKRRILNVCLDNIEPQLKEALWLVYVEDLSYAQAAEVMRISVKKLDHLLQKGKKELKSELVREGI